MNVYPHAEAILDLLRDAGLHVGDHQAPKSPNGQIVTPCVVVYMTPGTIDAGSLGRPPDSALVRFRLVSVGRTPGQAEDYADQVNDVVDGADLMVEDRAIYRCRRTGTPGVERDDETTPPCFYVSTPYQLMSNPAPAES